MNITADTVKQLRERTGAGMMECKKALVETKGDLDAAAAAAAVGPAPTQVTPPRRPTSNTGRRRGGGRE